MIEITCVLQNTKQTFVQTRPSTYYSVGDEFGVHSKTTELSHSLKLRCVARFAVFAGIYIE